MWRKDRTHLKEMRNLKLYPGFVLEKLIEKFKEMELIELESPIVNFKPAEYLEHADCFGMIYRSDELFYPVVHGKICLNQEILGNNLRLVKSIGHGLGHMALHQRCNFYHGKEWGVFSEWEKLAYCRGIAEEFEKKSIQFMEEENLLSMWDMFKHTTLGSSMFYRQGLFRLGEYRAGGGLIESIRTKNVSLKEMVENPMNYAGEIKEFIQKFRFLTPQKP